MPPLTLPLSTTRLLSGTKARDPRPYERADNRSLAALIAFSLVFVAFVGLVVVFVASMFVRVNHMIDRLDNVDLESKVAQVMDMAIKAAHNTERATTEIAQAATLTHEMAAETRPQVNHMLNTTHELVDGAKSFSFHPRLVIGT